MVQSVVGRIHSYLRSSNWTAWNEKTWLGMLVGFAILVRLGYVLAVGKETLTWGDELSYDQLAKNILEHSCYCFSVGRPTVFRAPLYPAILALIYAVVGYSYMAVLFIQALAGGLSALVLALVGKQMSGSLWVGLLASVMFTLNPLLVFATGLLYSETLYLLLLLGIVHLWLKLMSAPTNWVVIALGSGLLLGLSLLMKPNLVLFLAWLLVWGWIVFRSLSRAIVIVACIVLAMLVVVLPWSLRNFLVTDDFVLVSATAGLNLLQGNNSQVSGSGLDMELIDPLPHLSETERDAVYWQQGIEWIRTHPTDFARLVPLKLYKFFSPLETANRGRFVTSIAPLLLAAYALYYLLATVGMIKTARLWKSWLLAYMLIAYPVLLAVVFYGATRFGLVVQPFLKLFAAEAVVVLILRIQVSSRHKEEDRSVALG